MPNGAVALIVDASPGELIMPSWNVAGHPAGAGGSVVDVAAWAAPTAAVHARAVRRNATTQLRIAGFNADRIMAFCLVVYEDRSP